MRHSTSPLALRLRLHVPRAASPRDTFRTTQLVPELFAHRKKTLHPRGGSPFDIASMREDEMGLFSITFAHASHKHSRSLELLAEEAARGGIGTRRERHAARGGSHADIT